MVGDIPLAVNLAGIRNLDGNAVLSGELSPGIEKDFGDAPVLKSNQIVVEPANGTTGTLVAV